jgi:SAM-dependent methyltransferase
MYQAYTAPEIQGRHLASAAMATVLRRLQEEGFQRAFCCLQPDRTVSYSPPLRNGFLPMNWLGWVRLGPWRRVFRRPVRRLPACARRALGVGSRYWDVLFRWRARRSSHLDRFLGGLKRRAHLRLIRRWGGIPRAGRVLKTDLFEEADGTGRYLEVLRQAGTAVVGMDISSAICEHASRSSGAAPCGYAAADVRQLPFADGAFALVISPSTLDHFTKPEDLGVSLRELWRVLGEGGRLIVTLDNRHNVFDPLLRLAGRLGLAPYILGRSYSLREVVAELKAAGFAIVDTAAILHGPRLVPVLSVALARKLGWRWLRRRVHRMLLRAQALEGTRWKYWTASLLAALAEVRK